MTPPPALAAADIGVQWARVGRLASAEAADVVATGF